MLKKILKSPKVRGGLIICLIVLGALNIFFEDFGIAIFDLVSATFLIFTAPPFKEKEKKDEKDL